MDYMEEIARKVLAAHGAYPTGTDESLWETLFASMDHVDRETWQVVDEEAQVEVLTDLFYRRPNCAALAANGSRIGYPDFLRRLLQTLVDYRAVDGGTKPQRKADVSTQTRDVPAETSTPPSPGGWKKCRKWMSNLWKRQVPSTADHGTEDQAIPSQWKRGRKGVSSWWNHQIHSQLVQPRVLDAMVADLDIVAALERLAKSGQPPSGEDSERVLEWLLGRPPLVRRLAEELQMAVPFSLAFAAELDEIRESRKWRGDVSFDPDATISAIRSYAAKLKCETPGLQEDTGIGPPKGRQQRASEAAKEMSQRLTDCLQGADRGDHRVAERLRDAVSHTSVGTSTRGTQPRKYAKQADEIGSSVRNAFDFDLFGIAFSGGGIRSATFNLGVLQALASHTVLPCIDYLSTVSGGGYIGSWLSAWIKRTPQGVSDVQRSLSRNRTPDPDDERVRPIRFLRTFSNYLTPKVGFLSADTWTMVATWSRNTLLNQLVLWFFLVGVLLVPRCLVGFILPSTQGDTLVAACVIAVVGLGFACLLMLRNPLSHDNASAPTASNQHCVDWKVTLLLFIAAFTLAAIGHLKIHLEVWSPIVIAVFAFATACMAIGSNLRVLDGRGAAAASGSTQSCIQWRIVLPLFVAAIALSCATTETVRQAGVQALVFKVAFAVFWLGLVFIHLLGGFECGRSRSVAVLLAETVAAASGASVVWLGAYVLHVSSDPHHSVWAAATCGPPLLVVAFSVTGVIQIGLLGASFSDERREWVSRLGAWLLIYVILWVALFACAVYGPLVLVFLWAKARSWRYWWAGAGGLTWVASTLGGLLAGKKPAGAAASGRWLGTLAGVAMYVFVAGLLLLIALAIHVGITRAMIDHSWKSGFEYFGYWSRLRPEDWLKMLFLAASAFIAAVVLGSRVDVNEFSMHHFYKNRLVRCYLGASRSGCRRPNPFTGFDPEDDRPLADFRVAPPQPNTRPAFLGPLQLINATLNLVGGDDLASQERKAASFVFTPCYSGYELPHNATSTTVALAKNTVPEAFRPTQQFAYARDSGISLGTATAISGAAANPNQGYQSSPAAAFLMTMFNARLGWWTGNPRRYWKWRRASPRFGLLYLLAELTGSTNADSSFVNLSDGGHFENLGLYELIRRRCRFILAFDSEQDGDLTFGALGGAVRKCRVDFGVDIEIQVRAIRHIGKTRRSKVHCACGTIRYPGGQTGTLIYFKSSICGQEPADVQQYGTAHAEFPHQTTADQWFTESQFESYRALGEHIVDELCGRSGGVPLLIDRADVPRWFDQLKTQI